MLEIKKLNVPPAYQVVSNELRGYILSGILSPGDTLPSEIELAARFGVNRSTVREGIRQLESDGLVKREGRKRLLVTVPDHTNLVPRATDALVMREVTFIELWDISRALEPLAARLAAQSASEEQRALLRSNMDQTIATVQRGESPAVLDLLFHTQVTDAANSHALLLAREPVGALLYPAFEELEPLLPQARDRLVVAHGEILDGIERRDPAHAEKWAAKHIEDLRRGWLMANIPLDQKIRRPNAL